MKSYWDDFERERKHMCAEFEAWFREIAARRKTSGYGS